MRFGHRFESRYYQKSTLSEDLIVAWPLDEASGTRYPDYGGTEFNLTDVNTVGTADAPPGIGGLCAQFVGTSSEYLSCPDPFAPPVALSVSAWIYPDTIVGIDAIVTHARRGASPERAWSFVLATGIPRLVLSADGSATTTGVSASAVTAAEWSLVTAVWNGAAIVVYNNLTAGSPTAFSSALFDSTQLLRIGADNNSGAATDFFDGRIAQPLIWRRAITLAEITYLYNSGNGRPLTDWL